MKIKMFRDDFTESADNELELAKLVGLMESDSSWLEQINSQDIRISAMENLPLLAEEIGKEVNLSAEIIEDTMLNTRLFIDLNDGRGRIPLRNTAITAKINGNALSRITTEEFADIVNTCLKVAKGNSLVLLRNDKVSAVLSDEGNGYSVLEMSELLRITGEKLKSRFDDYDFIDGSLSHEFMIALYSFPKYQAEIQRLYDELLESESVYNNDIIPALKLYTSDVGICGVTLVPILITRRGIAIRITDDLKVPHKRGATLEKYEENVDLVFAKFVDAVTKFAELSSIEIKNPINAMKMACKKAGLPKKISSEAVDEFSNYIQPGESSNAHDIYLAINEILFLSKVNGANAKDLCRLEEMVSRCLHFNWTELDVFGEVQW